MAVLELVQRFTRATGIPTPSTVYANPADDVQQILELLNQEGRDLSARYDWQALTFEGTFTTVATEDQGTLTAAIGATQVMRKIFNDVMWNRTRRLPVLGPLSSKTWQAKKALNVIGPYSEYRIRGNHIIFNPAPSAGHSIYFDYVSKCWVTDSTGATYRQNIAADTDIFLLDDEIMLAGLEWRYLRKKGLSYAEEFARYEGLVKDAQGSDGTKPVLNMDGHASKIRPGVFIPIGSWNLP